MHELRVGHVPGVGEHVGVWFMLGWDLQHSRRSDVQPMWCWFVPAKHRVVFMWGLSSGELLRNGRPERGVGRMLCRYLRTRGRDCMLIVPGGNDIRAEHRGVHGMRERI